MTSVLPFVPRKRQEVRLELDRIRSGSSETSGKLVESIRPGRFRRSNFFGVGQTATLYQGRHGPNRLRLGPRPKARDYFVDSFQAPQFDATVIAAAFVPNLRPSCSPAKGYRRFRTVYLGTPGSDAIFNGRDPHAITTNFS